MSTGMETPPTDLVFRRRSGPGAKKVSFLLPHEPETGTRPRRIYEAEAYPLRRELNPAAPEFLPSCHKRVTPTDPGQPPLERGTDSIRTSTTQAGKNSTNTTPKATALPILPTNATHPRDELDDLIDLASQQLRESKDWLDFVEQRRQNHCDWGQVETIDHPASELLAQYKRHGVPATMTTENWTAGRKAAALARGPHKSAKEHIPFLRQEFCDMIKKGHWVLLPAEDVIDLPDLRLSPLGVVPQHDRRPRTICDYSYFDVNEETEKLAPPEAMQFGKALPRLLKTIHEANPRFGPVYAAKIDIADGFYRIALRPSDALRLGVLFPSRDNERHLIAVPLVLPMGWTESPPAFCAATETVADLANHTLRHNWNALKHPHRLDEIAETQPDDPSPEAPVANAIPLPIETDHRVSNKPVRSTDVYVDDFLLLAQGNRKTLKRTKRAVLQSLDKIFRPLSATDPEERQEPASLKKLRKGDGTWSTKKTLLGWDIDTVAKTIQLTPRRVQRLRTLLDSIQPTQRRIPTKEWHKILGELRSMAIALPGARGLFSLLQEAFRHEEKSRQRIRLTKDVHAVLADFRQLANDIASRPTRIAELIPSYPTVIGTCDAAMTGMGGVFFVSTDSGILPFLWRSPFPDHVQRDLVSFENPAGRINNSALELCGNIAHHDIIAQAVDVRERTIHTLSDNVASVFWLRKGSTTTTGPPAHLLRLQALHQRYHRYLPQHDYIPGPANAMADMCSHRVLANAPPLARHGFLLDYGLAQETVRQGVVPAYRRKKDSHWIIWLQFCTSIGLDPFMADIQDPIPYLLVFAERYRDGRLSASQKRVTAKHVQDVIRSIGQAFSWVGAPDPRLSSDGRLDLRLRHQSRAWDKADPPPKRVKPAPITYILNLLNQAHRRTPLAANWPTPTASEVAYADIITLAFFFLLRPTEYSGRDPRYAVFTLDDVHLYIGPRKLCLRTALTRDLQNATSVRLHFTTQKTGVKGDIIAHAISGHPLCCPVRAATRLVLRHRQHFRETAQPYDGTTRLASYYIGRTRHNITAANVTLCLRFAAALCFPSTGIDPKEITARSLRAGGAMALLCGKVDSDNIRLIGRWHSDAMLRYLHQEAQPVMRRLSNTMFNGGQYDFLPTAMVPLFE